MRIEGEQVQSLWAKYPGLTEPQMNYLTCLIVAGTARDAAKAAGVHPLTPYRWRIEGAIPFKYAEEEVLGHKVGLADIALRALIGKAVGVVEELLEDKDVKSDVRLRAARLILEASGRVGQHQQEMTPELSEGAKMIARLLEGARDLARKEVPALEAEYKPVVEVTKKEEESGGS